MGTELQQLANRQASKGGVDFSQQALSEDDVLHNERNFVSEAAPKTDQPLASLAMPCLNEMITNTNFATLQQQLTPKSE